MTNETWVSAVGFSNYLVSDIGRVKSKVTGKILAQRVRKYNNGTIKSMSVSLIVTKGVCKTKDVHVFMLLSFSPKPEGQYSVDHIDRNPLNNHLSNLRWATPKQQILNRTITRTHNTKFTLADLEDMYQKSRTQTMREIAKEYGVNPTAIYNILRYMHPLY